MDFDLKENLGEGGGSDDIFAQTEHISFLRPETLPHISAVYPSLSDAILQASRSHPGDEILQLFEDSRFSIEVQNDSALFKLQIVFDEKIQFFEQQWLSFAEYYFQVPDRESSNSCRK